MKLRFELETVFEFSQPVTGHVFRFRAIAPDLPGQHIEDAVLKTDPVCKLARIQEPVFGNLTWTGRIDAPHKKFSVLAKGLAVVDPEFVDTTPPEPYFLTPTALTRPGEKIIHLWHSLQKDCSRADASTVLGLMHAVHRVFSYCPGATSTGTTAEDALTKGQGVCQDYSHVLISLLRLAKIPAVYSAGLLRGTGATHAWVRAWVENRWISVDPTHNCMVDGNYLTIARGCDFSDAALERGIFLGAARQSVRTRALLEVASRTDICRFESKQTN